MNNIRGKSDRLIAILVFLFVGLFALVVFTLYSPFGLQQAKAQGANNAAVSEGKMPVIKMQLKTGPVIIQLRPDLAPKNVAQIIALTNEGFYDGIVFHRVIEGFMAQTGDPTGTGMGGSDLPDLKAEFTDTPFVRGTIGMARTPNPDSANSQFFIVYGDASFLNGQYTVIGKVIKGMENVDAIKKGDANANGIVVNPDKIISMRVLSGE
ncbi:Peptidyl-prolyl cis-trans isomerase [hydrothermal vent metagenome]|uniref:peptidylprolyl isomerase n=1 Tax=hydrothermal vent metagenome TaxID=652676 RepID=A0A3B0TNR6_9ZZZZ